MARKAPPKPVERQQISVWVLKEDLARADALAKRMDADRALADVRQVTRSVVLRIALTRGLEALEREYK